MKPVSGDEAMAAGQLADPLCRQSGAVDRRQLVTKTNGEQGWRHREKRSDAQGTVEVAKKALALGLGPEWVSDLSQNGLSQDGLSQNGYGRYACR